MSFQFLRIYPIFPQPIRGPYSTFNPSSQIPSIRSMQFTDKGLDSINLNHDTDEDALCTFQEWNWEKEILLISIWLNVSKNVIIGTDKKCEIFRYRIYQ